MNFKLNSIKIQELILYFFFKLRDYIDNKLFLLKKIIIIINFD